MITAVDGEVVKHYLGGILKECKGRSVNHAVLLVGYGKGKQIYKLIQTCNTNKIISFV